jgi:hypothetical protein
MNPRVVLVVIGCAAALLGAAWAQEPATSQASPFLGAAVCKECHADFHQAWLETKHSNTFNRLNFSDRQNPECLRCHVTATPEMLAAEGATPSLPGVQCEACHGPGRAHVEAARAGAAKKGLVVQRPGEKNCLQCHNPKSPHYRPFFYSAMIGLVHRVRK